MRWLSKAIGLDEAAESVGVANFLYRINVRGGLGDFLYRVIWAAGLLLMASALAEYAGLPRLAAAISAVMAYVPRLLTAAAILLMGNWLGSAVRRMVENPEQSHGLERPEVVGGVVQGGVVVIAGTLAAEQAGLETALVAHLILIVVAVAAVAVAVSFASGAREVIRHVVARHYYRRLLQEGDHVKVGGVHGVVIAFSPTALILDDGGEHRIIPCGTLMRDEVSYDSHIGDSSPPPPEMPPTDP